ncbi:MAG: APC family permease [Synergistaceae bacterium]|jgi:APA family basic amino acid/polyamine antiporter|nr:APC family permease [Synergistaceae bacterium]
MSEITSTKELKRVLGRKELLSIAIGQTIGAGIFALLGIGIGMTGKSINISMLIAAVFVMLMTVPMLFVSGTIRMRGGMYTQLAFLVHETCSGFFAIIHIIAWSALALYAISFADYCFALVPSINKTLVSFIVLTVFYVTNLMGIEGAAKLQNLMMLIMAVALTVFACWGMPELRPGYFSGPDFATNGIVGIFSAGALMTWAVGGANVVIHLGAEAKNPTKDIPVVMIVATIIIALFYAAMATVAAGVLPISEVVGKPLTLVASQILPRPLYIFFVVGGAMLALTTTLNAALGWVTKPILQACVDGWLPRKIGAINQRFKTPHIILTLLYLESLLPIFFKFNMSSIANMAVVLNNVLFVFVCFSAIRLETVVPELWNKSKFHVSHNQLVFWSVIGGVATIAQNVLLVMDMPRHELIGNLIVTVFAVIYALWRKKTGKVNMEISYEAS